MTCNCSLKLSLSNITWSREPLSVVLYCSRSHRLALFRFLLSHPICNSDSTTVQPSVSSPIPDRSFEFAQVAFQNCGEWRMANIPHWSGTLMFNSVCNLSFQPVIQLLSPGPSLCHPGELQRAVVLRRGPFCPSPSTFPSAEHSIYFIASLHLIALTSQIPWRVMRWQDWSEHWDRPARIFRRVTL